MYSFKNFILAAVSILMLLPSCVKTGTPEIAVSEDNNGMGRLVEVGVDDVIDTKSSLQETLKTKAHNWLIFPVPQGENLKAYDLKDVFGNVQFSYPFVSSDASPKFLLYENVKYDVYVLANVPSEINALKQSAKSMFSGSGIKPDDFKLLYSYGGKTGIEAIKAFGHMPRAIVEKGFLPGPGRKIKSPVSLLHELRLKISKGSLNSVKVNSVNVYNTPACTYPFSEWTRVYDSYLNEAFNDLTTEDIQNLNSGKEVKFWIPENLAGSALIPIDVYSQRYPDYIMGNYIYVDAGDGINQDYEKTLSFVDLDIDVDASSYAGRMHLRHYLGEPDDFDSFNVVRNKSVGIEFSLDSDKLNPDRNKNDLADTDWIVKYYYVDYKDNPGDSDSFYEKSGLLDGDLYTGQVVDLVFSQNVSSCSFVNTLANEDLSSDWMSISGNTVRLKLSRGGDHRISVNSLSGKSFLKDFNVEVPRFRPSIAPNVDMEYFVDESGFRMSAGGSNVLLPVDGSAVGFRFYDRNDNLINSSAFDVNLYDNILLDNVWELSSTSGIVGGSGLAMYAQKVSGAESMGVKTVYVYPSWLKKNTAYLNKFKESFSLSVKVYCPKVDSEQEMANSYYFTSSATSKDELSIGVKNLFGSNSVSFASERLMRLVKSCYCTMTSDLKFMFEFDRSFGDRFIDCMINVKNSRSGETFTQSFTLTVYQAKGIALYLKPDSSGYEFLFPVFIDYHNANKVVFTYNYEDQNSYGVLTWNPDGLISASDLRDIGQVDASGNFKNALTGTAVRRCYWMQTLGLWTITTASFNGFCYNKFHSDVTGKEFKNRAEGVVSLKGILPDNVIDKFIGSLYVPLGIKTISWLSVGDDDWNPLVSVSKKSYADFLCKGMKILESKLLISYVEVPKSGRPLSAFFGTGSDKRDYFVIKEVSGGASSDFKDYCRYYDFISNPLP